MTARTRCCGTPRTTKRTRMGKSSPTPKSSVLSAPTSALDEVDVSKINASAEASGLELIAVFPRPDLLNLMVFSLKDFVMSATGFAITIVSMDLGSMILGFVVT